MGSSLDNCSETPNFSGPANFDLTKDKINKTVDIGLNGTALSSDPLGGVGDTTISTRTIDNLTDTHRVQ